MVDIRSNLNLNHPLRLDLLDKKLKIIPRRVQHETTFHKYLLSLLCLYALSLCNDAVKP